MKTQWSLLFTKFGDHYLTILTTFTCPFSMLNTNVLEGRGTASYLYLDYVALGFTVEGTQLISAKSKKKFITLK